ncbi:hypothetical protein OH76DRAFT_219943 [Lentinus brumalis]|uniref:Uncharacterized protein n=1 Tax=Lentinus brumalis TaxID=2498619 RepID=A0A371CM96_9APHY|nr:hypothetical protein OH76DRAFT_219943 [Polyporus brumalis]
MWPVFYRSDGGYPMFLLLLVPTPADDIQPPTRKRTRMHVLAIRSFSSLRRKTVVRMSTAEASSAAPSCRGRSALQPRSCMRRGRTIGRSMSGLGILGAATRP